jgi:hypothetical protein
VVNRVHDDAPFVELHTGVLEELPLWTVQETLRIGESNSDPAQQFHMMGLPALLGNGSMLVPVGQSEIRVFNSSGEFVRRIGSRGEGPGEFQQLWSVHALDGDSIVGLEPSYGKANVFDSAGKFGRSYLLPVAASFPTGWRVLADQSLVFIGGNRKRPIIDRGDTGVFLDTVVLRRSPPGSRDVIPLRYIAGNWWQTPLRKGYGTRTVFHSGRALVAANGNTIAVAHGDHMAIQWTDTTGRRIRGTRIQLNQTRTDPNLKRALEKVIANTPHITEPSEGEDTPTFSQLELMPSVAEMQPQLDDLFLDKLGNTWARRWTHPDSAVAEYIVFDSSGMPKAKLRAPASFRLADVSGDIMIGRLTNADSVQTLSRMRIITR